MSADITDPEVNINYFVYKRAIHITRLETCGIPIANEVRSFE
jgi:hypothetical protein